MDNDNYEQPEDNTASILSESPLDDSGASHTNDKHVENGNVGYKYDVFLSYARKDGGSHVKKLSGNLQELGLTSWYDNRSIDPHQDFTAEIESAIENSEYFVCCITPDTRRSDSFVRREISFALALKKPIIPLLFEDGRLPIHIINLTYIDFNNLEWDEAFANVCERLESHETTDYALITTPQDPYRDYLNKLYQQIVRHLDQTVFSLFPEQKQVISLSAQLIDSNDPVHYENLAVAFQELDRRLLLVGEAGTGKTITLMAFAREAIARRLDDSSEPVPLFLTIALWDSDNQHTLIDILAALIDSVSPKTLEQTLQNGEALLLLDGLDELRTEREKSVVNPESLSKPSTEAETIFDPRLEFIKLLPDNNYLLLTCRLDTYQHIKNVSLPANGIVRLNHLTDQQIQAYLNDYPELWDILSNDSNLLHLAKTPLLLCLFAFAFSRSSSEIIKSDDLNQTDIRDAIVKNYVQQRFLHEKTRLKDLPPFDLAEVNDILGYIAMQDVNSRMKTNILYPNDIQTVSGDESDVFVNFCVQMNLLVPHDSHTHRFVHLLMRDYFANQQAAKLLITSQTEGEAWRDLRSAIVTMGELKDDRMTNQLCSLVKSEDSRLNYLAAEALGQIGQTADTIQIIKTLVDGIKFGNSILPDTCSESLAMIGQAAVDELIELLKDEDKAIHYYSIQALGKIADERAIEPLLALLVEINA